VADAPKLMLMTSAPLSAAWYTASMMAEKNREPAWFETLSGMMVLPPATPTAPIALFAMAAATPAQAVPWPASSLSSWGSLSLSP